MTGHIMMTVAMTDVHITMKTGTAAAHVMNHTVTLMIIPMVVQVTMAIPAIPVTVISRPMMIITTEVAETGSMTATITGITVTVGRILTAITTIRIPMAVITMIVTTAAMVAIQKKTVAINILRDAIVNHLTITMR